MDGTARPLQRCSGPWRGHWAASQKLPVIACGDYNFDWFFPTEKGNAAFDYFLEEGVWTWVRPERRREPKGGR